MPHLALRAVPPPVPQPTRVGPYRLLGVLGEGTTGRVYRASRLPGGPECALKYPTSGRGDAIIREDMALSLAQHRAVVAVLDRGHDGALPYLVMERLDGLTLAARLRDGGPLDLQTLVDLVIPVCDALAQMHGRGVIHRDVKPANLFVVRGPYGDSLRLLDFAEAQIPSDALPPHAPASTEEHRGTPAYLAPEVGGAQPIVTPAIDQYALGVVLYECLSGRRPFAQASSMARLLAKTQEAYTPLRRLVPQLPAPVEAVVRRALRPNAADRFPDLWHLAAALLPFASEAVHDTWRPLIASATSDDCHLTAPISRTIVRRVPAVRPTPAPSRPPPSLPTPSLPAPPLPVLQPPPAAPASIAARTRIHAGIIVAAGLVTALLVVLASSVSLRAIRRPRRAAAPPASLVVKPPSPLAPLPPPPPALVTPPPAPRVPSPPPPAVARPPRAPRPPRSTPIRPTPPIPSPPPQAEPPPTRSEDDSIVAEEA